MKSIFALILVISVFTGCRKNNSGGCLDGTESTDLKGTWELRSVVGGMSPDRTFLPGNGNIVKFSELTFEKIRNGQIIAQGNYSISQGNNPETGLLSKRIDYTGGYLEYYEITGNYLTLYSGIRAADGTISRYEKL